MYDVTFPVYSYRSFTSEDLEYTEPDSLIELNRYDYINLTRQSLDLKRKMLRQMLDHYFEIEKKGFDYKDCMLQRYFYKQFVIRENTDEGNQIRYYKYTLSDWNDESKEKGLDDRVLTIETYAKFADGTLQRDVCYKLKVGHKTEIINQINGTKDKYDEFGDITDVNLYIVPLYFLTSGDEYRRIDAIKSLKPTMQESILLFFLQAIYRFIIFNLYMIENTEENKEMIFNMPDDSYEIYNLIDYIKKYPSEDKKVLIRDFKYNLSIKMNPANKNIYDHYNKVIRTLCAYRHQVHSHWQRYHKGSKKLGT